MNIGNTPVQARTPRQRLFYLDLVRALATVLIVLAHFNNPFLAEDGRHLITNQPFGIYVGSWGVSLFLIISGSALAYTYRSPISLKTFYFKRFKGIYPMFWIAWILGTLYFFIDRGGHPINAASVKSVIWTVLGVDGLASNFGIPTAYLLGEWFLGFIIIFYVVFPLLNRGVEKRPLITAGIVLALYLATLVLMRGGANFPASILLTTRLPELAFGIYLIRYVKKVPAWTVVPAAIVLVVSTLLPTQIPEDVAVTFVGISSFLILVIVAEWIAVRPVREIVSLIAKYSYPIFLVHHVVIMELYASMNTMPFLPIQRWVMFAAACAITFGLAVALDHLVKKVVAYTGRSFSGVWWRPEVSPLER